MHLILHMQLIYRKCISFMSRSGRHIWGISPSLLRVSRKKRHSSRQWHTRVWWHSALLPLSVSLAGGAVVVFCSEPTVSEPTVSEPAGSQEAQLTAVAHCYNTIVISARTDDGLAESLRVLLLSMAGKPGQPSAVKLFFFSSRW